MRIPITIKIPVNVEGRPSASGLAQIAIKDLGSGLEKITVRIRGLKSPNRKLQDVIPPVKRDLLWHTMPTRFPIVSQPKPQAAPAMAIPRVRYSVKTIHITLTWPTLPTLLELVQKLRHLSRRAWLRIGIATAIIAALVIGLPLLFGHKSAPANKAAAASSGSAYQRPQLTRGTPPYPTILPAGKTIQQLGGWVRISPPNKNPVYTYTDKIADVQIDVSEQPLPAAFQKDTANKISQLAASYNATDKFEASNNTKVYVGSGGSEGEQSVIVSKNGLLILIKSAKQLTNNQWAAYISSLR